MPHRHPAPFFKKSHNAWCAQLGGKQLRLSVDYDDALTKCGELLKARKLAAKQAAKFVVPGRPEPYTLGRLSREFLTAAFVECSERTKGFCEEKLGPLVTHVGSEFPPEELKPLHVKQWIALHARWKKGTARTVWQAAKRLMWWGERNGLTPHSPLCDEKKPGATSRTVVITPEQYAAILANLPSAPFRDLVTVAWETGARPQELLMFEARHHDAANERVILSRGEGKDKDRPAASTSPTSPRKSSRLARERPETAPAKCGRDLSARAVAATARVGVEYPPAPPRWVAGPSTDRPRGVEAP